MYPLVPCDAVASAVEMACYGFTVVAALWSCLWTLRF
jgi:hypothetical protein